MKRILLCLILFGCVSALSAETLTLSRESVVQMAVERNEGYQAAQLEKDRIRGRYLEARAGRFPSLRLTPGICGISTCRRRSLR